MKRFISTSTIALHVQFCILYNIIIIYTSRGYLSDVLMYTVEPLNNGRSGDEHFVHCSEVVPER